MSHRRLAVPVILNTDHYVIINKPPFLYSQPPQQKKSFTNTVTYHVQKQNPQLLSSAANINTELHVVHRLDYNVSGCLCLAKTHFAAQGFSKNLRKGGNSGHLLERKYICLTHQITPSEDCAKMDSNTSVNKGPLEKLRQLALLPYLQLKADSQEGTITLPIDGKEASTRFKILSGDLVNANKKNNTNHQTAETSNINSNINLSILGPPHLFILKLQTGKKHQIRKHMNYINQAILGDYKYNYNDNYDNTNSKSETQSTTRTPLRDKKQPIALHSAFIKTRVGLQVNETFAPIIWNDNHVWDALVQWGFLEPNSGELSNELQKVIANF